MLIVIFISTQELDANDQDFGEYGLDFMGGEKTKPSTPLGCCSSLLLLLYWHEYS